MNKKIFIVLFSLLSSISTKAQTQIPFVVGWIDPTPVGEGPVKGPIAHPLVYLENHTLTFSTTHPEYILYIKDE